jgi:hypothetical protein
MSSGYEFSYLSLTVTVEYLRLAFYHGYFASWVLLIADGLLASISSRPSKARNSRRVRLMQVMQVGVGPAKRGSTDKYPSPLPLTASPNNLPI